MAYYDSNPANFATGRAMSEAEIMRAAPSVFAMTAHESRSERFAPIPTIDVLRGLAQQGFVTVGARQSSTRVTGKADFTKHLIRLRKIDDDKSYRVGDTVCEILLKNANDGTCQYDIMAGLFRIACMNSMVSQIGTLDSVKVRHSGQVGDKVIEGTFRVLGEAQKALVAPSDWSTLNLSRDERQIVAEAAHTIRFADNEGEIATPVRAEQLLTPRRRDDINQDLWTTFNVVQENVIRGGLHAIARDANNRRRRVTTRAVNGIDQDLRLNKALWTMAQRMAELKAAH